MRDTDHNFETRNIYDNSPASEARFKVGDKMSYINGKRVSDWVSTELKQLLRETDTTVRYTVLRDSGSEEVKLKLIRII